MQAIDWVTRVNAKIAAMEFTNKDTAADEIAEVVADEIVSELSGVSDEDIKSVAKTVVQNLPNIKITPPPPSVCCDDETDDPDDDMPGLISEDYCNIHQAMYVAADKDAYSKICDTIDDLYEFADRQDKDLEVEQDDKGRTLLHWALLFRCPSMVIQTLINAYPDILSYADNDDWLPLHYAARYSMSLDVVDDVYSIYPEAILELNEAGIPPNLIARYGGAPKEIADFLEERMRATKAAVKAAAKAEAKAEANAEAEAEEVRSLDDENAEETAVKHNAENFDTFLAILFIISTIFVAVILANAVKIIKTGEGFN